MVDEDSVKLADFTKLNDDAGAESLSNYQGEVLDLGGITQLSDASVESLSKYEGQLSLPSELKSKVDSHKKS